MFVKNVRGKVVNDSFVQVHERQAFPWYLSKSNTRGQTTVSSRKYIPPFMHTTLRQKWRKGGGRGGIFEYSLICLIAESFKIKSHGHHAYKAM